MQRIRVCDRTTRSSWSRNSSWFERKSAVQFLNGEWGCAGALSSTELEQTQWNETLLSPG